MPDLFDLIIHSGTCVLPGGQITKTNIGITNGRISAIGTLDPGRAQHTIDASNLHILPGVIDSQVHFREPGLEHKEDLQTGTASAALGGVTAIFEMPNTTPSTLTSEDLADKLQRASGRAWVDHAFFIGASDTNIDQLAVIERQPGCSGVKVFMGSSTGNLLVAEDDVLLDVLKNGIRRVAIHCEDDALLTQRKHIATSSGDVQSHPLWRDEQTAIRATSRLLRLARIAHRRVHVLHVTTADEMSLLAQHKDIATVEVTPQHLTLSSPDCYSNLGTKAQMNPPIREAHHQAALWEAISNGVVDVIGSDHAPHTKEEKSRPYPNSPSGMPGVQTLVPLMLDHVSKGRLSLARFVDLTSAGPARIYNIAGKGRLAVGYDADFTIVDLGAQRTITDTAMASRCGWTPFDGKQVTGWPIMTIIRGQTVMRDDTLMGTPNGSPVRFGIGAWSPQRID